MGLETETENEIIPATTEESKPIRAINRETVHKICSGQVVLTLAVAVKELVENAIDAGATTIEVRLKEYGSELIEVIDNGSGVEEINFEALTLKHHTSKISQFSDLSFVSTLGFRGEALSSLCALSDLIVYTRHRSVQCGTKIEYDHNGHIKSKIACARQQGTTVSLSNLFATLPVRHKDFHKNLKREFSKMLELLYAYCIISGVRILCTNQTKKSPRTTVVATQGSKSLKENIICVFGTKQMESLVQFVLHRPEEKILEEYSLRLMPDEQIPFTFEGYISKCTHGSGRSSSDRQFYFMNKRPCDPTRLAKVINEVYRSFNNHQYPFVVLNICVEQAQIDVNVTPDKRQVFLEKEKLLLATVKMSLLEMFKEFPSTFKMQNLEIKSEKIEAENNTKSPLDIFKHASQAKENVLNGTPHGIKRKGILNPKKFDVQAKGVMNFIFEKRMKISEDVKQELSDNSASEDEEKQIKKFVKESYNSEDSDNEANISTQVLKDNVVSILSDLAEENRYSSQSSQNEWKITIEEKPACILSREINSSMSKECTIAVDNDQEELDESTVVIYDTPLSPDSQSLSQQTKKNVIISVDDFENVYQKLLSNKMQKTDTVVKFRSEITSENAEKELQKHISKDMFTRMQIIGQFNKGFIVTKLDSDLFIIDQHATDEKYNFETLQQTKVLENQKLVNPKPLDLTAANENLLIENLEIFTKNGFTFNIDENAESRKKVSLTAIPMCQNYQFGKEDIDELLFMLQDDSTSTVLRPSRVRAMFASKACRKSVMVGSVLSQSTMRSLVKHMGEIDQPWNCPHGRPTMRHLINLDLIERPP